MHPPTDDELQSYKSWSDYRDEAYKSLKDYALPFAKWHRMLNIPDTLMSDYLLCNTCDRPKQVAEFVSFYPFETHCRRHANSIRRQWAKEGRPAYLRKKAEREFREMEYRTIWKGY